MDCLPKAGAGPLVSIIVLVHNALCHVRALFQHNPTQDVEVEWIVVDNASDEPTARFVQQLPAVKVIRSDQNLYFAAGNNLGADSARGKHILLLNSDVVIKDPRWLAKLMMIHRPGVTAYGLRENPTRADGFCFLVDRNLYYLDPYYKWDWSVTKLQANLLAQGYVVKAIRHFTEIVHYGGGSGPVPTQVNATDVDARSWFRGLPPVEVIESSNLLPNT